MKKKKIKKPQVGDKIYVGSSFYISHGSDDFAGGICTISSIEYSDSLDEDHCNYCMIGIKERPGYLHNYKSLMEKQKELKKTYGKQKGHPDPDIDTPWLEEGDWVNGKEYKGPPQW